MLNKDLIEFYSIVIYDESRNGKILDKHAIYDIAYFTIQKLKLFKYVKNINFNNKDNYASYVLKDKSIEINYEKCLNTISKLVESDKHYNNKYEKLLEINSYILRTVIHEFIHSLQYKTVDVYKELGDSIDFSKEELKAYLLDNSFEYLESYNKDKELTSKMKLYYELVKKHYHKFGDFYKLTPSERMANITSAEYIYLMHKQNHLKSNTIVKNYEKKKLIEAQLDGYDFGGGSPAKDYLLIKEDLKQKAGFDARMFSPREEIICNEINNISKEFNLKNRLYYGLNINFDEYIRLDSKVKRLK